MEYFWRIVEYFLYHVLKQKIEVGGNETHRFLFAIESQKIPMKWRRFQAFGRKHAFCNVMNLYTIIVQASEELLKIFAFRPELCCCVPRFLRLRI